MWYSSHFFEILYIIIHFHRKLFPFIFKFCRGCRSLTGYTRAAPENAQQVSKEQERKAKEALLSAERSCRKMEEACRAECERQREEAKQWAADYKRKVVQPLKEYIRLHPGFIDELGSK